MIKSTQVYIYILLFITYIYYQNWRETYLFQKPMIYDFAGVDFYTEYKFYLLLNEKLIDYELTALSQAAARHIILFK